MKIINHKILTFALLALMLSVVVSGGCGGGSGGGENPASNNQDGDDYGASNSNDPLRKFTLLNKSVWKVVGNGIGVYSRNGEIGRNGCPIIEGTLNYNIDTISFIINTNNNNTLLWSDGKGNPHIDDLTVKIKDPDDNTEQTITLLRSGSGFQVTPSYEKQYNSSFTAYKTRYYGTDIKDREDILINNMVGDFRRDDVAYRLQIMATCKGTNGQEYFTNLQLIRTDLENWETDGSSVYSEVFMKLNNTEWKIRSVDVVGPIGDPVYYPLGMDSYNYENVSKITLFMNSSNTNGNVSGGFTWLDGNGNPPGRNKPLTVTFMDLTAQGQPIYTAPLLTPAVGFKYKGSNDNNDVGTLEYQTTLSNGITETIFQHDWKNKIHSQVDDRFVQVNHSFTINNQQYSARMLLVPVK